MSRFAAVLVVLLAGLWTCGSPRHHAGAQPAAPAANAPAAVDGRRIRAADAEPWNWLSHGRSYDEQRFSPLDAINERNVQRLGLAWYLDYGSRRGVKATPLVVDGVLYTSGPFNTVYALDAATGRERWRWTPAIPGEQLRYTCCGVSNRGVAVWQGRIYEGLLDGRLVALDAADGRLLWAVQTTPPGQAYSITGAPRVVNGKVVIGNGGAEFGVRGYVSAYDALSGELLWRFYTVPGNPAEGFESGAMEAAARTWSGEWWRYGGGGTVWDSLTYDPALNLLYVGTGNGGPWMRDIRSPGGGDNLYLSSIVALDADTGAYRWHYQTTPGDSWDYTATQHMILADLEIDGAARKVLLQAPKNGFFYVIDRATGELISAKPLVPLNWTSGIDMTTGRPRIPEESFYRERPITLRPGPIGAHNWQPMAYSPLTGLVYVPVTESYFTYARDTRFRFTPGTWNVGQPAVPPPPDRQYPVRGHLAAWDPAAGVERWRVPMAGAWNGGALATAGKLLLQGNQAGRFAAYQADTGRLLWSAEVHTGIVAAPVSYAVDGEQFVAVNAGWGGSWPLIMGERPFIDGPTAGPRLLVYKLDGKAVLPAPMPPMPMPMPPPLNASAAQIARGAELYHRVCYMCHGVGAVSGGTVADLRHMQPDTHARFLDIVLRGSRSAAGMAGFADVLSRSDAEAIHAYVISRANEDWARSHP